MPSYFAAASPVAINSVSGRELLTAACCFVFVFVFVVDGVFFPVRFRFRFRFSF
jgi:hypothetical protein